MADEEGKKSEELAEDEEKGDDDDEDEEGKGQEEMFPSKVVEQPIVKEMEDSYLSYAMSVIISRALPDVRDGLKPVHRRILYSMHKQGLRHGSRFTKSARTVGDVIAKYHPHGDSAVYDSLVRMAQNFSMRYPLIRGQGNFGSIDGDSAAAMRYTEAKMEKITDEMLVDIEKETVEFRPNYDASINEPSVMPAKLPNLLLNGTMGIAVGMATNIPPHNLNEVIDALLLLADNSEMTIDDIMECIHGPDFPTAGRIYDVETIKSAYATGRGGIVMRGKAEIEEMKSGKFRIIITEIPYQVNKASMITKIADLVREKKIIGITDIRDESSKDLIRVVIELKRDSYPKKILNQLYKLTTLQSSFGMNMIALVDGLQPRLLNLKSILEFFIEHRKVVITNRVKYDLKIAKARAHILEGLKIALDQIDKVIATIRASATKEDAKVALIEKFKFTDLQADAILQMRLQTLAGLERKKVEDELKEKLKFIAECETILKDPKRVVKIMTDELKEVKEKYGNERRTEIIEHGIGKFSAVDTIPNEPMIVALTKENYIKRLSPTSFRAQHRGGKGVIGMGTKSEDEIVRIVHTSNHNNILYFTNKGRVFKLPVYEIPKSSRQSKGQAIVNLLQLGEDEFVTALLNVETFKGKYLAMATKNGTVKKTEVEKFKSVRKAGLIAIKLRDGDELKWVAETSGNAEVMILSKFGKCIRFPEKGVRSMGRNSTGVRGIRLKEGDAVVEMDVVERPEEATILVVMENGLGKRSKLNLYRLQSRGGTGIKAANITKKTGKIVGAKVIYPETEADIICFSSHGQTLRTELSSIPSRGRATQGVIIMRMKEGDHVASISLIHITEDTEEKIAEKVDKSTSVDKKEEKEEKKEESSEKGEKAKGKASDDEIKINTEIADIE